MSRNVVVIGTQWGDEGKGAIVDLLAERAHAVVRFQVATTRVTRSSSMERRPYFT